MSNTDTVRPIDPKFIRTDISVVVVNFNTAHLLGEMQTALQAAQDGFSIQTIIVDNASTDNSVEVLQRDFADATLILNKKNIGFGRANNQAIPHLTGRYVLLLNTDAFVAPDTLSKAIALMDSDPSCGIVGVRLVGRDGIPQPACRFFPTPWNTFLARSGLRRFFPKVQMVDSPIDDSDRSPRACDWVVGCCMLIRREVVEKSGLFDPRFFLYFEEVDFCRRSKAEGWKVVYLPTTTVIHIGGESAKSLGGPLTAGGRQVSELQIESELLYYRKNLGLPGLTAHIFLTVLTDAMKIGNSLRKRRGVADRRAIFKHAATLKTLLQTTRFGTVSTRP